MNVKRVSILFLAALSLVYGGYNLGRSLLGPKQGEDFAQYYMASRMVLDGEGSAIYDDDVGYQERAVRYGVPGVVIESGIVREVMTFAYPPFVAFFMLPFAAIPYDTSRVLFYVISLVAIFLAIPILFSSREGESRKELVGVGILGTCLFFPVYYSLYMGQINSILFLFCALTLFFARKEKPWLAGLFLSLSVLIKLFPLVLILFFLLKRRIRVVGAAIAWMIILVSITGLVCGFEPWRVFFNDVLPLQYSGGAWVRNQGYTGFFTRLLTRNPHVDPILVDPHLAERLSTIAGIVTVGIAVLCTRRSADAGSYRFDIEFGFYFVAALLALAKSYEHLGLFLLFPFLFTFEYLACKRKGRNRLLGLVLVSFCIWAFILTDGYEYRELPSAVWANGIVSVKFLATLLLFLCHVWILIRKEESTLLARTDFQSFHRLDGMSEPEN